MDMDIRLEYQDEKLDSGLDIKLERLRKITSYSSDLLINNFEISGIECSLLCCEGMLATSVVTQLVLVPLTRLGEKRFECADELFEHIDRRMLLSVDRPKADNYGDTVRLINSGFAVLVADGSDKALAFGVQGYSIRGISQPDSEQNIMGAKDGFTETVRVNMSLIRRRMKSPFLKFELFVKGTRSNTDICLVYMTDRVPAELIGKIKKSLNKTELETVLSGGYIRPFLERKRPGIFSTTSTTQRPDVLCSKLLEGRVGVIVDGTPFVIVVPRLFTESFQTMDDYNCKPYYAFFIRWVKYAAFFVSLLLPGFYVAVAEFHPGFFNRDLLALLAEAESKAPLSLLAESVLVLLMYEIIREAGIRLPQASGGAVSIVSGLIIGDAAVESGLISTPMLTVIAISVISGFVLPDLDEQITVFRFLFLAAGGFMGLSGISFLGAAVIFSLCSEENYGIPLSAPLAPLSIKAMRDVAVRVGFRKMQRGGFTVEKLNRKG